MKYVLIAACSIVLVACSMLRRPEVVAPTNNPTSTIHMKFVRDGHDVAVSDWKVKAVCSSGFMGSIGSETAVRIALPIGDKCYVKLLGFKFEGQYYARSDGEGGTNSWDAVDTSVRFGGMGATVIAQVMKPVDAIAADPTQNALIYEVRRP